MYDWRFTKKAHQYAYIEKLVSKYSKVTCKYCAVSGATSGIGGVATTVALGGADIANMAVQLYRLNQKIAVLNGFSLENSLHREKTQLIYLKALGIEGAFQAGARSQLTKAIAIDVTKKGPSKNATIKLIIAVAQLLGVKLSKATAVKFVPVLGAVLGGGMNYWFANNAAEAMAKEFKDDYFDRWQLSQS